MRLLTTIFVPAFLAGCAFAANSKLNQYSSLVQCELDQDIISHSSPVEGTCHFIDSRTDGVYLVVGGGAALSCFIAKSESNCDGDVLGPDSGLPTGACITLPAGTKALQFTAFC